MGATWPATSGDNESNYTVFDGNAIATLQVNQSLAPSDYTSSGASWENLGSFYIAGDTLSVQIARGYSYYSVVADAVQIQRLQGDHGADDDFHVQSDSPTIDAGDPASYYLSEPAPNGGRINLGSDGNTAYAATSPAPMVQILSPNGLGKYVQGEQVNVQWRSDGLTTSHTVALINAGGPAVGVWSANAYETSSGSTGTISASIDTSGVTNPAPQAVYQTYAYASGTQLTYQLPVPDGTYTLRLDFVEPSYTYIGGRTFNILLQGTTVQSAYDIFKAAGAKDKATSLSFTVIASGGSGISLALVNVQGAALLSALDLSTANPSGSASPTVNLDVSADNGSTWTSVATNQPVDAFGNGSYLWTVPATATPGNQYLMRVTANGGSNVSDLSDGDFLIAPNNNTYYVNDNSTVGDQYTTAVGNNANSGKTPDQPMASLAALLTVYANNFHSGDTIYVDTGTYNEIHNLVLGPQLSGVTIQGPTGTGVAVVSRGNTNSGQYVFQLTGAQNVTLSHLAITGGYEGIYAASGEDSTGLTVSNCTIYGNSYIGADVETSNNNATFSGDTVYGQSYGLYLSSVNNALLSGNTVYGNSSWGIEVYSGVQDVASANNAYANAYGIYVSGSGSGTAQQSQASGNTVHDNSSVGIAVSGDALAVGNTAYRQMASGAYGLEVQSGAVAQQNVVHDNYYGIYVYNSSQALNNRVYNNSQIGINAAYASTIQGNTVYSNGVGLQLSSGYSQVSNNLIYANVNQGILANGPDQHPDHQQHDLSAGGRCHPHPEQCQQPLPGEQHPLRFGRL